MCFKSEEIYYCKEQLINTEDQVSNVIDVIISRQSEVWNYIKVSAKKMQAKNRKG
jgi:hypothetical protein